MCAHTTGNQRMRSVHDKFYECILIDEASNRVFTRAIRELTKTVTHVDYVLRHRLKGVTKILITDRGSEYMNRELNDLLEKIGVTNQTAATGRHE